MAYTHKKGIIFWTKNRKTLLYACNLNLKCVIYKEECIIPGESYVLAFPIHPIGIFLIGMCRMKTGNDLQVVWHKLLLLFLRKNISNEAVLLKYYTFIFNAKAKTCCVTNKVMF